MEYEIDNHKSNPDNILLSDSKIMKGEGKAIVLAVGDMTYLSRIRTNESLVIHEQRTNLEYKLERISEVVGKWAYLFCIIIGLVLLAYNTLHMMFRGDKSLLSNDTLLDTVRILILALCLLIVAIPEGMPLAISIAMAMSVDAMKKDKILIKNLDRV
jgi:P-type E1-E2 ATPase